VLRVVAVDGFVIDVKPRSIWRQEHHWRSPRKGDLPHRELELTLHLVGSPGSSQLELAPEPNGLAMTCGSTAP